MTKYFKLLGVALIAMSLALVSCDPTEENPTDNQQDQTDPGTNPQPDPDPDPDPDPEPPTAGAGSIAVKFGGESWEAVTAVGVIYPTDGMVLAVALSDAQGQAYPRADVCVYAAATGTYTDEIDAASGRYTTGLISYVEYYEDSYLYDQNGTKYGDWWAKSMTLNITGFDATAMTVSATVNAVMFDASAALVDGVGIEAADTETMVFVANALQMQNGEGKGVSFLRK